MVMVKNISELLPDEPIPPPLDKEILFNNAVREYTLFGVLAIVLVAASHLLLSRYRRREGQHNTPGRLRSPALPPQAADDEATVDTIAMWVCTFSLSISLGAVLLLPLSIISNELLAIYRDSHYVRWINRSLIQGLWNMVFLFSNLSLFVALPFAYLFTEAEGFPGSKKGVRGRMLETVVVLVLLVVLVLGVAFILAVLLGYYQHHTLLQTIDVWSSFYLPFLYSLVSCLGVLFLLLCTPVGLGRLFSALRVLIRGGAPHSSHRPPALPSPGGEEHAGGGGLLLLSATIAEDLHAVTMEEQALARQLQLWGVNPMEEQYLQQRPSANGSASSFISANNSSLALSSANSNACSSFPSANGSICGMSSSTNSNARNFPPANESSHVFSPTNSSARSRRHSKRLARRQHSMDPILYYSNTDAGVGDRINNTSRLTGSDSMLQPETAANNSRKKSRGINSSLMSIASSMGWNNSFYSNNNNSSVCSAADPGSGSLLPMGGSEAARDCCVTLTDSLCEGQDEHRRHPFISSPSSAILSSSHSFPPTSSMMIHRKQEVEDGMSSFLPQSSLSRVDQSLLPHPSSSWPSSASSLLSLSSCNPFSFNRVVANQRKKYKELGGEDHPSNLGSHDLNNPPHGGGGCTTNSGCVGGGKSNKSGCYSGSGEHCNGGILGSISGCGLPSNHPPPAFVGPPRRRPGEDCSATDQQQEEERAAAEASRDFFHRPHQLPRPLRKSMPAVLPGDDCGISGSGISSSGINGGISGKNIRHSKESAGESREKRELLLKWQAAYDAKKRLERVSKHSLFRRCLVYPLGVLVLVVVTGLVVLLVLFNTLQLISGFKALPLVSSVPSNATEEAGVMLGKRAVLVWILGPLGAVVEVALILYLVAASLVGCYSLPLMKKVKPVYGDTPMVRLIINCVLLLVLASALPLLATTLGLTNFDLLGDYGRVGWLGNLWIVLSYNLLFASAAVWCLVHQFTAALREEIRDRWAARSLEDDEFPRARSLEAHFDEPEGAVPAHHPALPTLTWWGTGRGTCSLKLHADLVPVYEKSKDSFWVKRRGSPQWQFSPAPKRLRQLTMKQVCFPAKAQPRVNKDELEKRVLTFVVNGLLPLSTVEKEEFKSLVHFLNPMAETELPSRRKLSRCVESANAEMTAKIRTTIAGVEFLCTTADIWSSRHRSFIGVTAHWINEDLTRGSAALACRRFEGVHSYDRIADMLQTIHSDFGISHRKIVATVTDNGSNFKEF